MTHPVRAATGSGGSRTGAAGAGTPPPPGPVAGRAAETLASEAAGMECAAFPDPDAPIPHVRMDRFERFYRIDRLLVQRKLVTMREFLDDLEVSHATLKRDLEYLRDRFHANEILVSLMLVYVAEMLLSYLVYGPWKDPAGYNFPQTITFLEATRVPKLMTGLRMNIGLILALVAVAGFAIFLFRTYAGFQLQVGGLAPQAARYAGFSSRKALWTALLLSGGMAGLAGALDVAGPQGQLTPYVPLGYGFAAIIVAFVGRLHPVGIVFSAILMSMFFIGGELAQSRLGLPKAMTGVFQGLLLFTLLACDTFIHQRLRWANAK